MQDAYWTAGSISSRLQGQLVPICAYIVMAISLNLTVGVLGELSLGHAGFMSAGAFSGIVAASCLSQNTDNEPLILVISMIVGGIVAAIVGFLVGVPVLRLQRRLSGYCYPGLWGNHQRDCQ